MASAVSETVLDNPTNLLPVRQVVVIFFALSMCALVTSLHSLIVSAPLSTVSAVFNAGSVSSWNALCLAMAVYFVGNLAACFSNSIIQLIVCRGIAGAGGGGISSMLQILISDIVPLRERGKYVGISAGVFALGYAFEPIIGGVLAEKSSWRWCFWVTLPLSVVATMMAVIFTPSEPMAGGIVQKLGIIDYPGIILTLGGCPLICRFGFVFFSALYYLPLFFQVVLGYYPSYSGTFLLPIVLSQVASSLSAGFSVHTGKYCTVVYTGYALAAIGSGCISIFTTSTSKAVMAILIILTGFRNGMTMQTTTVAAQASVARKDMSVVTAVRNFLRMLGGAIFLPVASSLLNNAIRKSIVNLQSPSSTITIVIDNPSLLTNSSSIASLNISSFQATYILSNGYTKGFRDVFLLNAAMSATATLVSAVMIEHKELLRGDEEQLRKEAAEALRKAKMKNVEKDFRLNEK
ncbi:MFS general substrate transporter [Lentinula aciculospora]|uniref:MFS general substrate transporter n=1 Tax=Lentinula aciculospora TaxID=153920 RepID=A0A9W9DV98_9AGAR|nr:MFS general substrate transporter [Lentinula aciculospora]KAJ4487595.1 MFS general substrate transporter [Lentinula aciculospora]